MGSQSDTHPEEIKVKAEEPFHRLFKSRSRRSTHIHIHSPRLTLNRHNASNPTETANMVTSSTNPNSSIEPPPAHPPGVLVPIRAFG